MYMKKIILGVTAIAVLFAFNMALAKDQPNGTPFTVLWGAIEGLQTQIDEIELSAGPQGEQGEKGDTGEPGENGVDGTDGITGAGNIAFINNAPSGKYALTLDGKAWVWAWSPDGWLWTGYAGNSYDVPIPTENIVQWEVVQFLDSSGNVWMYDNANWIDTGTPVLTTNPTVPPVHELTWGGGGTTNGLFRIPFGVAVDSIGNVYVTDRDNHRIQKFDSNGNFLLKWGSHGSGNGQFINADHITLDENDYVYVTDWDNHNVQKFDVSGNFIRKWGSYGNGNGQFNRPVGIAADKNGNIYVADKRNHRIQKFDSDGNYITKWGGHGTGNGQFDSPTGVAVSDDDIVYTVESLNNRVQKFNTSGGYLGQWGSYGTGSNQFRDPNSVAIDIYGYIYVSDRDNERVKRFDKNGNYYTEWNARVPTEIAIYNHSIYVVDPHNHKIRKFSY